MNNNESWGSGFEREVFDKPAVWNGKIPPYQGFRFAMMNVIFKQPVHWNPLKPHTKKGIEILDSVRVALREELRKFCSPEAINYVIYNTGFYDALGTSADWWHGTDGLICCDLGSSRFLSVRVDLKVIDEVDADLEDDRVVITSEHFTGSDYCGKSRLSNIAEVIAGKLASQLMWYLLREEEKMEVKETFQ